MKNGQLLLRCLVHGLARWEIWPNRGEGRIAGELTVGGVEFVLDVEHDVPVLTQAARDALELAWQKHQSKRPAP